MEVLCSHCRTPPLPSLIRLITAARDMSSLCSNSFAIYYPPSKTANRRRPRPLVVTFSYKSKNGQAVEKKRELLEQYGLTPDEFLSEASPKTKRRKELANAGRKGRQVTAEEPKTPRETHRLLQVGGEDIFNCCGILSIRMSESRKNKCYYWVTLKPISTFKHLNSIWCGCRKGSKEEIAFTKRHGCTSDDGSCEGCCVWNFAGGRWLSCIFTPWSLARFV